MDENPVLLYNLLFIIYLKRNCDENYLIDCSW